MRTLEILLLIADLLALAILAVPRLLSAPWWHLWVIGAMALAFAQVVVEGPRWQMVPAYALSLLFFVVSIAQRFGVAGDATRRGWGTRVAIGLGVAGLAVAVALPLIIPVFRFPPPTGPYATGTLTVHWVDATRAEAFSADPRARRELLVQIWYPAQAQASGLLAAYLQDAGALTAAFARIHHKPAFVFGHLKYVTIPAMHAVPAASDRASFPVLLFLEGATGFRQMNTYQVEHLASHGYIVVAIDQPGAAATVVFPDGHQILGLDLAQFQSTVGPSYLPHKPALPNGVSIPPGLERLGGRIIPYLAGDVVFTLDQLAALNRADPSGILTGKLDLQRVGAFGISLGGIVVGEACRREPRIRACLVMDAPMSADVVHAGLRQPGMWITRDAASMRLERQRSGGWSEAEIEAHQTSMRAVYEGLSGAGYFVRVPGMFHSNFTDVATWTPIAEELGLAGPIDPQHAHDIVNAYSLAFFDRHVRGRRSELLDGPAKQYPDAVFETRAP
jgi:predicted dienelactone hydrolase